MGKLPKKIVLAQNNFILGKIWRQLNCYLQKVVPRKDGSLEI